MKKAIYALSADPIINGHINIIERSLKVFDHVLVGIGVNPNKKYTFTLKEREYLTKKSLQKFGNKVSVKSFEGLLADFAYEREIKTIIRGARNSLDFDFERMITDVNHGFKMDMDTFILVADPSLSHISSSTAKELQRNMAKNLNNYVPLIVKQALEFRISDLFLIGITGGIGCGKSYVTKKLLNIPFTQRDFRLYSIDIDHIGRYILKDSTEPLHISTRKKIADLFGKDLLINDKINVNKLLNLLFDDIEAHSFRSEFEKIMAEPTLHMLRKKLLKMKGIVFINSAIFVEAGICDFVNNYLIVVECDEELKFERLRKRGYSDPQITNRIQTQHTDECRIDTINKLIKEKRCGKVFKLTNSSNSDKNIIDLFGKIKDIYEHYRIEINEH